MLGGGCHDPALCSLNLEFTCSVLLKIDDLVNVFNLWINFCFISLIKNFP